MNGTIIELHLQQATVVSATPVSVTSNDAIQLTTVKELSIYLPELGHVSVTHCIWMKLTIEIRVITRLHLPQS
jgi:hypothetical protein